MTLLSDKARIVRMTNEASEYCKRIIDLISEMQKLDSDAECVSVGVFEVCEIKNRLNSQYLSVKEQIAAAVENKEDKCSHEKLILIKYGDREVYECKECGKVLADAPKNSKVVETINNY